MININHHHLAKSINVCNSNLAGEMLVFINVSDFGFLVANILSLKLAQILNLDKNTDSKSKDNL